MERSIVLNSPVSLCLRKTSGFEPSAGFRSPRTYYLSPYCTRSRRRLLLVNAASTASDCLRAQFGCAYGRVAPAGLQSLPEDDIEQHYYLGQIIGSGAYGTVRYAVNKNTMQEFAVKVLPKQRGNAHVSTTLRKIEREIHLHQKVQECGNVVKLFDAYQDDSHVYLVLELCKGNSIEAYLQANGPLNEASTATLLHECLKVVATCHSKSILHGDVKPANFVFTNKVLDSVVDVVGSSASGPWLKALDFGCSQQFTGQALRTRVGTPVYMAPEVFLRQYGLAADMWSVGMLMYQLLSGRFPFWNSVEDCKTQTLDEVMKAVIVDEIPFNFGPWTSVSSSGLDLIHSLLNRDPKKRVTAAQALEHQWFKEQLGLRQSTVLCNNIVAFEHSNSGVVSTPRNMGLVSS